MLCLYDLRDSYKTLVKHVMTGNRVEVRGQVTYELLHQTLYFPTIRWPMLPIGVGRNINSKFAAVEALSTIAGMCNPQLLLKANPAYASVLVSGTDYESMRYAAYGPRLSGQYYSVARQLCEDPSSRQAVMSIWQRQDLWHKGDKPCTMHLQFFIRNNELQLHTTMRSNDVWLGTAYDVFVFTQIQLSMFHLLRSMNLEKFAELGVGAYYHSVGSLHIYERDLEKAGKLRTTEEYKTSKDLGLPQGVIFDDRINLDDVPEDFNPLEADIWNRTPQVTAFDLLSGTAPLAEVKLNPWYVEQLQLLGIEQTGPRDEDPDDCKGCTDDE